MNNPISKRLRIALFSFVIIFLTFFTIFFSTSTDSLEEGQVQHFNDNWSVFVDSDYLEQTDLPQVIDADKYQETLISNTLSNDFDVPQTLLIRGSLQNVIVKVDGQVIYEKDFEDNIFNTYASIYHFIEIPENSNGDSIEIILVSPYRNMSGTLNEIHYGHPSAIEDFLMDQHGYKVYVSLFMLVSALLFSIINYLFFYKKNPYNEFLGIFGIFISLWLFAESRIVQLYINNDFLIGSLAYISLAAAPIAAVAFIKSHLFKEDRFIFSSLCIIFTINLFTNIILHITGIAAFFETVTITVILISIAFIIAFALLLKNYIKTKKKEYRNFLFISIVFSIFLFLEVYEFANKNFSITAIFATTGIAIIILFVFVINIFLLSIKLRNTYEQELYHQIAHTDQLTKVGSRFAFEKDLDELFYNSKNHLSLLYFDFDDLKFFNDTYGHLKGDEVLIDGSQIIKKVFGTYGSCYRIGGDEFACLSKSIDNAFFEKLKDDLRDELNTYNKETDFTIRLSAGYAEQTPEDEKPSDLIQKADENMYKDKVNNKAQVK